MRTTFVRVHSSTTVNDAQHLGNDVHRLLRQLIDADLLRLCSLHEENSNLVLMEIGVLSGNENASIPPFFIRSSAEFWNSILPLNSLESSDILCMAYIGFPSVVLSIDNTTRTKGEKKT